MTTKAAYLHNRSPAVGGSVHSWRNALHTGHNINGFSLSAAIAKCVLNGQDKRKTEYIEFYAETANPGHISKTPAKLFNC